MIKAKALYHTGVSKWDTLLKVHKNRYAVSGLNQTTDPYTQVIKLVDSQLKAISKLEFEIPDKILKAEITYLIVLNKSAVLGKSRDKYIHLFQYRGRKLRVVQIFIRPFEDDSRINNMVAVDDRLATICSDQGKLAIIKLTFH